MLRAVPFGERLGHAQGTLWGVWGQVGGRAVLATAGRDASVLLWDAERGSVLHALVSDHPSPLLWGRWGGPAGVPCWPPVTPTERSCYGTPSGPLRCPRCGRLTALSSAGASGA